MSKWAYYIFLNSDASDSKKTQYVTGAAVSNL